MFAQEYTVKRIQAPDLRSLFVLAKQCLFEKGIEKIKDDLLMWSLKNAVSQKLRNLDFGLFKHNQLIGFAFVEVSHMIYLENGQAQLDTIFLTKEHRTEENYIRLVDYTMNVLNQLGIGSMTTTNNFILCNDCEIFNTAMKKYNGKIEKIWNILKG